jgi:multidrug resistance efflux pump
LEAGASGDTEAGKLDDATILLPHLRVLDRTKLRQVLPTVHRDATLEKLLADLATAEQELVGAMEEHAEKHPEVVRRKAIVAQLNQAIDNRIEGILAGLSTLKEAKTEEREVQLKRASERRNSNPLRAELQVARTKLDEVRLQLELCTMTAPAAGTIQEVLLQPGERATPEQPVIFLLSNSRPEAAR